MNVIELKNVKKNYPLGATTVHALRGVDLAIKEGDFISIVGPSGSGKTTLLNIIGCIDHATEGLVKIHDEDVTTYSDRRLTDLRLHTIGFIFQTFNLIPVLTTRENVEFPLLLMKKENLSRKEIRSRAEKLIEEVGLTEQINHKPYELSGGPAPEGGHRPGPGDPADHRAGGRAHGEPGLRDRGDDPEADEGAEHDREDDLRLLHARRRHPEIRQRRREDQRRADGELRADAC